MKKPLIVPAPALALAAGACAQDVTASDESGMGRNDRCRRNRGRLRTRRLNW